MRTIIVGLAIGMAVVVAGEKVTDLLIPSGTNRSDVVDPGDRAGLNHAVTQAEQRRPVSFFYTNGDIGGALDYINGDIGGALDYTARRSFAALK